jgi:glucose-specific phosphotransferase system IIA component
MMSKTVVLSPFTGSVLPIEAVPDPVFAEKMLGDGLAVELGEGTALAPIDGKITVLHSSGHAFAIQAENEVVTVLVHIGLDTVKLKGQGFTTYAKVGDMVKAGQKIVTFDLGVIAAAGYSPISPVILPDLPEQAIVEKNVLERVTAGQDVLYTVEI